MPGLTPIDPTTLGIEERGQRGTDSPAASFELNNSTIQRVYTVPWANRLNALKYFLGEVQTYVDGSTTKLSRTLPHVGAAEFPDIVAVKCTALRGLRWNGTVVAGTPLGTGDPYVWSASYANRFHRAELTIQYEHVPYDRVADADAVDELARYVSVDEFNPSAEYLTLPGSAMQYFRPSGTLPPHGRSIPFSIGRVLPQTSLTLTWHNLPNNVWTPDSVLWKRVFGDDTALPYLGAVNKTTFLSFPPGTLLFEAIRPARNRSPYGDGFWYNLSYTFLYKPQGHLKLYFAPVINGEQSYAGFYYVGRVGSGYRTPDGAGGTTPVGDFEAQYIAREFADLFKVG